ncbi:DUF5906 domain-containing protein [Serratia fonticola]|uniref:DUF5906 domain-containing protein n=1 Tax=Serratia fonticola TaxID=47917 RepID=UPI0039861EA6
MRNIDLIREVKRRAAGLWFNLLQQCSVDTPNKGHHGSCPICGGTDRFHFIDDHDGGEWHCRQCDAPNHGDGLDLVSRSNGITITEAAEMIAGLLGIIDRSTEIVQQRPTTVQRRPVTESGSEVMGKSIAERVAALLAKTHPGHSEYLAKKGLPSAFEAMLDDGSMVLVLRSMEGVVTGAQIIKPSGEKRLLTSTKKKAAFIALLPLPEQVETVVIAEGYATSVTSALLIPDAINVAAIDAGNLLSVAQAFRETFPDARIIIAADNDWHEPGELDEHGKPKVNAGKLAAEKTAAAINGWVTLPPGEVKADWDDFRQLYGVEAARQAFNEGLHQPGDKKVKATVTVLNGGRNERRPELHQMAASQRGELLARRYGKIAVNPESEGVSYYDGAAWVRVSDVELCREMAAIFIENNTPFSDRGIDAAVKAMKLQIPVMEQQPDHLIGFSNGVYDLSEGAFRPHHPGDWLQNHNGIEYTAPVAGENLPTHAPCFYRWLSHAAGNDEGKMARIQAALFMVLAKRYDWQMFLEVTGEGGSGKSVFAHVATLLAGEHNTASGNMSALDTARGRAQFVNSNLILLPDQPKYVGEGTGIKAITGGDAVEIDGKYEKQFSMVIKAVVMATNNEPMAFTERNGGISRRRVIFPFNNQVKDADKDPDLSKKISLELPVIIRHLLALFVNQDKAKRLLLEQRSSSEALVVKRVTNPVIALCASLSFLEEPRGLMMGGGKCALPEPRRYLYHLYKEYLEYQGLGKPMSVENLSKAMKEAAAEYQQEYKTRKVKGVTQTNVEITELVNEFLPHVYGREIP